MGRWVKKIERFKRRLAYDIFKNPEKIQELKSNMLNPTRNVQKRLELYKDCLDNIQEIEANRKAHDDKQAKTESKPATKKILAPKAMPKEIALEDPEAELHQVQEHTYKWSFLLFLFSRI